MFADRHIVLASASPRRLEILRQIGIEPELHPVEVEEDNTCLLYTSPSVLMLLLVNSIYTDKY